MSRLFFWIIGGLVLGGVIHLIVILTLPNAATHDIWNRLEEAAPLETLVVLDDLAPGEPNPLGLDPELLYAVCRLDLEDGPGIVNGQLPLAFWSVAVFNRQGHVIYSTTNRSGSGALLDMGLFNPAQTRLLAEQRFEIDEGLLIVEAGGNDAAVVVRLAPPHPAMRERYREALAALDCGTIR
ncbi:hypothetical protein NO932_05145 [Pelagibacterium sp. 26DY04]|uniref:DUF1254 domain-containing protein n=1 Tax=Pelagibacterium sp. 26DY04 TaxID=2967130 RepID=UPI002814F358|nr:hypothetical protein [Pelagibacterium sp. 26DY04]WMT87996.1 hypothetical protein NO932_05145 [Pelagibacterium sp. 26DY04]